jgi:hypothetical protein
VGALPLCFFTSVAAAANAAVTLFLLYAFRKTKKICPALPSLPLGPYEAQQHTLVPLWASCCENGASAVAGDRAVLWVALVTRRKLECCRHAFLGLYEAKTAHAGVPSPAAVS